jgi:hypothetical protein
LRAEHGIALRPGPAGGNRYAFAVPCRKPGPFAAVSSAGSAHPFETRKHEFRYNIGVMAIAALGTLGSVGIGAGLPLLLFNLGV